MHRGRLKPHCHLVSGCARCDSKPSGGLRSKTTVYGLNGLRPSSRAPFKSSTAFRALAPTALFRWVTKLSLRRFAFRPKMWHTLLVVPVLYGIHHRLQGAGLAHLDQRTLVLIRGLGFRGGSPSTSPRSPGPPPPSNASAAFARSGRFRTT